MKAKITIRGTAVEAEGTPDELVEFIRFIGKNTLTPTTSAPHLIAQNDVVYPTPPIYDKIPSARELVEYIETNGGPDMTHSLRDLSLHFLGQHIEAKKEPRLFGRFFGHLQTAQRRLEVKHHRKFEHYKRPTQNGNGRLLTTVTYSLRPRMKTTALAPIQRYAVPWTAGEKEVTVTK